MISNNNKSPGKDGHVDRLCASTSPGRVARKVTMLSQCPVLSGAAFELTL